MINQRMNRPITESKPSQQIQYQLVLFCQETPQKISIQIRKKFGPNVGLFQFQSCRDLAKWACRELRARGRTGAWPSSKSIHLSKWPIQPFLGRTNLISSHPNRIVVLNNDRWRRTPIPKSLWTFSIQGGHKKLKFDLKFDLNVSSLYLSEGQSAMDKALPCHADGWGSNSDMTQDF